MRDGLAEVALTPDQQRFAGAGIKALIPVAGGRTLLELILENLTSAGFSEVCLVIGPEHVAIRDFCSAKELDVRFAVQDKPLGTANAVLAAEDFVAADELFLVVNSDNLYPVDSLRRLRETNRPAMLAFEREALIERSNIPAERIAKFATVEIDAHGMLRQIIEKPEQVVPGSFVSMNAWLFSPSIFPACRAIGPSERGEYEITAAVQYAIDKQGEEFVAVQSDEGVLDLSSRSDIEGVSKFLKDK
jgi:dTDP-glucose pyrophosphorylase